MPLGQFASDDFPQRTSTGTGAPSQPRAPYGGGGQGGTDYSGAGGWRGPSASPTAPIAGGSGYTTPGTQLGSGQFAPGTVGPSATMPGSLAQYPNVIYNPSATPFGAAQQIASTLYGPQQQLLADQLARQEQQLGMVGLNADYRTDALHRDNALANQGLGLDRAALGVDRNLTNTQLANLQRLRGILGQRFGLAGEQLANQLVGFKVDEDKARDMAKRHTFDLRSQLTARGAFNTVANERGTGRINRDLGYALREINVGRKGADIGYRGNILGLKEQGINYDNQAAGLNARLANIGIDTQRIGLKEEELANSLQDGLHQIGMDSMLSINGLLDAMGSTNTQQAQLAATILGEVMGYANLPPDVLAYLQTQLNQKSPATAEDWRTRMG